MPSHDGPLAPASRSGAVRPCLDPLDPWGVMVLFEIEDLSRCPQPMGFLTQRFWWWSPQSQPSSMSDQHLPTILQGLTALLCLPLKRNHPGDTVCVKIVPMKQMKIPTHHYFCRILFCYLWGWYKKLMRWQLRQSRWTWHDDTWQAPHGTPSRMWQLHVTPS